MKRYSCLLVAALAAACIGLSLPAPAAEAATGVGDVAWHAQNSGTTQALRAVFFVDDSHGWVVGSSGTILATSDGGATWVAQYSTTVATLRAVFFVDVGHGWAVGSGGTILATTNGGVTWSPQVSGTLEDLNGVAFPDPDDGWAVGDAGTIVATGDGGDHWYAQNSGLANNNANAVSFFSPTQGFVCTGDGPVIGTSDAGGSWTEACSKHTGPPPLRAIVALDFGDGFTVGDGGKLGHISDSGGHWSQMDWPTTSDLSGVSFVDVTNGWAVGAGGLIIATADAGYDWNSQSSGTLNTLRGVIFPDISHGWAVGDGGVIVAATLDAAAPVTTASAAPSGWTDGDVTVTLAADDAGGSGIAHTYYQIDGGAQQTYDPAAKIVLHGQGEPTVTYWSVDIAGNAEANKTIQAHIDTTAPSLTVTTPAEGGSYPDGSWSLAFTSSDAVSGIDAAARSFTLDGGPATADGVAAAPPGAHTMVMSEYDNAGNPTTLTRHFTVTPRFQGTPTVNGLGSGAFTVGDSASIGFSLVRATPSGSFRAWLKDTSSGAWLRITPSAGPIAALPGSTTYSVPWTVSQAPGSYKLWVYYYADALGTESVTAAATSGSITIAAKPTPIIGSPNSGSFTVGDATTLDWSMSSAVSSGSFRAWLKNTITGAWVRITPAASPIPAEHGSGPYSLPWSISQPPGTYKLWVYYYADAFGSLAATTAVSSGTITIAPKPTPGILAPNGGAFLRGGSTTVIWSMSSAVSAGSFRVWLKNTLSGAWLRITPAAGPLAAVPGLAAYPVPWVISQPAGAYKLWVYYYADAAGTLALSSAVSSGTITLL